MTIGRHYAHCWASKLVTFDGRSGVAFFDRSACVCQLQVCRNPGTFALQMAQRQVVRRQRARLQPDTQTSSGWHWPRSARFIGAIAMAQGAAIGGIIGAAGGAGSVYVQGKDNLELLSGTELTIRAGAPR